MKAFAVFGSVMLLAVQASAQWGAMQNGVRRKVEARCLSDPQCTKKVEALIASAKDQNVLPGQRLINLALARQMIEAEPDIVIEGGMPAMVLDRMLVYQTLITGEMSRIGREMGGQGAAEELPDGGTRIRGEPAKIETEQVAADPSNIKLQPMQDVPPAPDDLVGWQKRRETDPAKHDDAPTVNAGMTGAGEEVLMAVGARADLQRADSALGLANSAAMLSQAMQNSAPGGGKLGVPSGGMVLAGAGPVAGGNSGPGASGGSGAPGMRVVGARPVDPPAGAAPTASGSTGGLGANAAAEQLKEETVSALARQARQGIVVVEKNLAGKKTPAAAKAYVKVAQGYAALGDNESAMRSVNQSLKLTPDDVQALDLRAALRADAGDSAGSAADARHALAIRPDDTIAQLVLGHGVRAGQISLGNFGQDKRIAQPSESGWEGTGVAVIATPEQRKAADAKLAAAAAGIAPGETPSSKAQALLQSAVKKLNVGDIQGSLFDVSRALMEDPKSVRSFVLRAHISNLPQIHNFLAAIADADKALALDANSAAALFEKGYALLLLDRAKEAVQVLARGVSIEPKSAMGHLFLAMALEKAGAKEEALAEYKKAAELDSTIKPVADEAAARLKTQAVGAAPASSDKALWIVLALGALGGLAAAFWKARAARRLAEI